MATTTNAFPATWQPMESAPEDEAVILATTGGWVGQASKSFQHPGEDECRWAWAGAEEPLNENLVPVAWQPLPPHPAIGAEMVKPNRCATCDELDGIIRKMKVQRAEPRELLRRVDHTLTVHGKVDADTDLHVAIKAAIAKATGAA